MKKLLLIALSLGLFTASSIVYAGGPLPRPLPIKVKPRPIKIKPLPMKQLSRLTTAGVGAMIIKSSELMKKLTGHLTITKGYNEAYRFGCGMGGAYRISIHLLIEQKEDEKTKKTFLVTLTRVYSWSRKRVFSSSVHHSLKIVEGNKLTLPAKQTGRSFGRLKVIASSEISFLNTLLANLPMLNKYAQAIAKETPSNSKISVKSKHYFSLSKISFNAKQIHFQGGIYHNKNLLPMVLKCKLSSRKKGVIQSQVITNS